MEEEDRWVRRKEKRKGGRWNTEGGRRKNGYRGRGQVRRMGEGNGVVMNRSGRKGGGGELVEAKGYLMSK